jgi:hypothetical protein
MQSAAWAALIRHIPPGVHDNLMLVTHSGTEMSLNAIIRIDHEFMAVKGRLSGSQDTGRIFFIPYSEIDYLGFQKAVKETDFQEMFGGLIMPEPAAVPAVPVAAAETPPEPVPVASEPQPVPQEETAPAPARQPVPIKSAVLERFRARSNGPASSPNLPVSRPPVEG